MQTRSTSMVNSLMVKHQFNMKMAKYFFLISGQLGVHLVKNPWLTIKKCSRKEVKIGEKMFVYLVFQQTKMQKNWKITQLISNGHLLNIIMLEMVNALLIKTMVFKVYHMFCLQIQREKLFLLAILLHVTLKKILMHFLKEKH